MVAGYSPSSGAAGGLAGGLASAFTPVGRSGSVGFTGTSLLPAPGGSGLKGGFGGDPGDHRHAASFAHAMQTHAVLPRLCHLSDRKSQHPFVDRGCMCFYAMQTAAGEHLPAQHSVTFAGMRNRRC